LFDRRLKHHHKLFLACFPHAARWQLGRGGQPRSGVKGHTDCLWLSVPSQRWGAVCGIKSYAVSLLPHIAREHLA